MSEKTIGPKSLGLGSRDRIIQIGRRHYALFIDRKSRIVMADAPRIMKKVRMLAGNFPESRISVQTTAPVCSKTAAYFKSRQIDIIRSEGAD